MTDWVKYTASQEQIAEINDSILSNGYVVRNNHGSQSDVLKTPWHVTFIGDNETKEYLICNPNPLADMICQWQRTGQPVWIKLSLLEFAKVCRDIEYAIKVLFYINENCEVLHPNSDIFIVKTNLPIWGLPGAQYSLTPFED